MKPPRAYARGILHFFGGIRRSTLLRSSSFGGSALRIAHSAVAAATAAKAGHPRAYARGLLAKADKPPLLTGESNKRASRNQADARTIFESFLRKDNCSFSYFPLFIPSFFSIAEIRAMTSSNSSRYTKCFLISAISCSIVSSRASI